MLIEIDEDGSVTLSGADDFRGFAAVDRGGPGERRRRALATFGVPGDDGRHVFVDPAWIRRAAGALAESAGWRASFDAMTRYAAEHGWLDDEGRIRAHVEGRPG